PKQAARYLIPVLPFALWAAWEGLARLGRRWALGGAALGVVLSVLATSRVVAASWRPEGRVAAAPARTAAFLRARAQEGALAAEYDARWWLLTGRPCVHVPYDVRSPRALARFLAGAGVRELVVEDTSYSLRPLGGAYQVPSFGALRALAAAVPGARREFADEREGTEVWRVAP
ncbi:MAG: hypothetical protein KGM24_08780, partial [Elusimicrobia bacterium]|nr:hypothetical protein [Elusimicrobiota bacterium]